MVRVLSFCLLMLISLTIGLEYPIYAQSAGSTTSSLTGTVTDQEGAAIAGAIVRAKQLDTNLVRETNTAENGTFNISQLPPSAYELTVTAEGFKPAVSKLTLLLGKTTHYNFALFVGATSEIVEVTTANAIDEAKIENSTNIDRQRIDTLPINRRDFLDFSLTAARVLTDRVPAQGVTATSGLSFNGQSARGNSITIDGLDNNDTGSGSVRATFSQEAVQEFQVISDSYTAEFGRALSGVVNIVTKGGSNDFHGNLFMLNRNDRISARDAFSPSKPPFSQYQFGNSFSGPIKKDHAFFFTAFERLTISQNNIVTISDATVAAVRRQGLSVGNGPEPLGISSTSVLARVDWNFSPNNNLYVRYNFGGTYNGALEPFGGLIDSTNAAAQRLKDNSLAVSDTYINTGLNLINEVRFLYGRRNQDVLSFDPGPEVRLIAPEGQVRLGRNPLAPEPREERIYQIIDNVTLTRGDHQIKFGIDYNYLDTPGNKTSVPLFTGGVAFFTPLNFSMIGGVPNLPTLTGLQALDPSLRTPAQLAFLQLLSGVLPTLAPGFPAGVPLDRLSLPLLYGQGFGDTRNVVRGNLFSVFMQDDFKLRPNFTIRAGLRYDINRTRFIPSNDGNFSPRIGFSYHPKWAPKANIHASYGLFYGRPFIGTAFLTHASETGAYKIPFVPFPFSLLIFNQPGHRLPESMQLPTSFNFQRELSEELQYAPKLDSSYTQQVSFGIDYQIARNTELSVAYNYVRGLRLFAGRQINPVTRPTSGNPAQNALTGRPIAGRGDIFEFESAFDSYYHGFTVTLNKRFANKFGLLASYTFAKSIDNLFDIRTDVVDQPVNPLLPGNERSLSLQDVRNRFVLSGIWDLNYSNNPLLKDFQFSTIINLNSGRPFNLLAGEDLDLNGDLGRGDRPQTLGRNVGMTPGFANIDMRLLRSVTIKERFRIQGFFEIFNLFNRVNISEVDRIFPADARGNFQLPSKENGRFVAPPERYRNAFAPRQFQLGFRLAF